MTYHIVNKKGNNLSPSLHYTIVIIKRDKNRCKFYFLFAVIANQYIKPGAKPTMSGIHTGHPSTALAIKENQNLSYLNPS